MSLTERIVELVTWWAVVVLGLTAIWACVTAPQKKSGPGSYEGSAEAGETKSWEGPAMRTLTPQQEADHIRRNARARRQLLRVRGVDEVTIASTPDGELPQLLAETFTQLRLVPNVDQSHTWNAADDEDPDERAVTLAFLASGRTTMLGKPTRSLDVRIPVSPFDDFGGDAA